MTDSTGLTLGAALDRLAAIVAIRSTAAPETSYTAKLLADGPGQCAKKVGEEAIEVALAGSVCDGAALTSEAADLIYHLLVLLKSAGVEPEDVGAELLRREGVSGLDEKASRRG